MLEQLKRLINDFMRSNDLNTYKVRMIVKGGGKSPLGASINIVNAIIKKDELPKNRKTLFKILDAIGAKYEKDSFGNIKFIEYANEDSN